MAKAALSKEEKAAIKAAKAAEKAAKNSDPVLVKSQHDCFNGFVEIWKDGTGIYVRQTRKDFTSDYLTVKEAEAKFNELVNDTMF